MTEKLLPRLLTIPETSRQLGVGVRQLRAAIARGELRPIAVGAWPRLDPSAVRSWLREHGAELQ